MRWKRILEAWISPFIPRVCLSCNGRLQANERLICEPCAESVTWLDETNICDICGSPISGKDCEVCWESTLYFDRCRAVLRFDGAVQALIHKLKYDGYKAPALYLADLASEFVQKTPLFEGIDAILPVPLHRVRQRERGYNQSALLAQRLATRLNLPYIEPIRRKYYTKSQTRLSKDERMKNLSSAFELKPQHELAGLHLLLVDDVFTTGSTVNEVSKVLRIGKPASIRVLAISRAQ